MGHTLHSDDVFWCDDGQVYAKKFFQEQQNYKNKLSALMSDGILKRVGVGGWVYPKKFFQDK